MAKENTQAKPEVVQLVRKEELYKDTASIDKAVLEATTAGNSVQLLYQRIAASAVLHLGTHKDIRVIRNILETMPEGFRRASMSAYFDKYAAVTFAEDGGVMYDADKPTQLGLALENAWWKAAKEQPYRPFVLIAELEVLYNRALKRLEKADPAKGDMVTAKQLNELGTFINAHKKGSKGSIVTTDVAA